MIKLADQLKFALIENLPKGAKLGTKFKKVIVDGETFNNLTLDNINSNKSELIFSSDQNKKHTFNYSEQEIILK